MSKKCTPFWRETHLQVKTLKTPQVRSTFGSWDVEKVHAVLARSTFANEKAKKKLRFGAFLKVEMSKKCTPLWRETHLQVKTLKTPQVRITFGSWDIEQVHTVVARSKFRSQNVKNTRGSDHFWRFRCRFAWQAQGIMWTLSKVSKTWRFCSIFNIFQLQPPLHHTTLQYTTLHSTTLQYTPQQQLNYTFHYTTLHSTTLHYSPLHYNTLLDNTTLHDTTQHTTHNTQHTALHYATRRYTSLVALHYTTLHHTTLHHTALHSFTLHYTTLPYPTLHYITIHYWHYRRNFRSETSDNMDSWKAEVRRVRRGKIGRKKR